MKRNHTKLTHNLFPKSYKQFGIVVLIVFVIYIAIRTVQTQQRKKFEGFKEGGRNINPREDSNADSKENTKENTKENSKEDKKESFNVPSKGNTIIINT